MPETNVTALDGKTVHVRFPHLVQRPARTIAPHRMLLGAAAAPAQKADTYDWDTAFAIKFPDANLALAKPGTTPTSFSASESGTDASGTFGAWQLSGGDGTLIHMDIPITTGTMNYQGKAYDMAGAIVTLELELMDLPQPLAPPPPPPAPAPAPPNGTPHQVVANATKPVSVTNLTNVPNNPGFVAIALMTGLLESWFTANLASFTHAFVTINLNEKADKEQFQWMKPTSLGWAVSSQGTLADSIFGALSMTGKRTPPKTMQISPNAIPAGQRAAFLIAQQRFLEELLLPGIHTMFPGSKTSDFAVINDGTMIRNVNQVSMDAVELSGKDYTPILPPGHFEITLEANEIVTSIKKAEVDFSPGIKITMDYTGYSSIELAVNSKGEQILNYAKASEPIIDHNVEVASWVIWTEVAVGVLAAVATLGTGAFAKKVIESVTLRVVATVIVAIVGALLASIGAIIEAIATGDKDKIPPVTLMVISATDPVKWPDSKDFLLTSAGLNESLQFGGNPQFAG